MTTPKPPSKDSPSYSLPEAKSRMTRDITEISMSLEGDARSVLDRYLTIYNRHGDETTLPVVLRPHSSDPVLSTASNRNDILFHLVGTMIVRYWEFAENPTIHTQRHWDAVDRIVHHIDQKGIGEYVSFGSDAKGYRLFTEDQAERLSGEPEAREKARRG